MPWKCSHAIWSTGDWVKCDPQERLSRHTAVSRLYLQSFCAFQTSERRCINTTCIDFVQVQTQCGSLWCSVTELLQSMDMTGCSMSIRNLIRTKICVRSKCGSTHLSPSQRRLIQTVESITSSYRRAVYYFLRFELSLMLLPLNGYCGHSGQHLGHHQSHTPHWRLWAALWLSPRDPDVQQEMGWMIKKIVKKANASRKYDAIKGLMVHNYRTALSVLFEKSLRNETSKTGWFSKPPLGWNRTIDIHEIETLHVDLVLRNLRCRLKLKVTFNLFLTRTFGSTSPHFSLCISFEASFPLQVESLELKKDRTPPQSVIGLSASDLSVISRLGNSIPIAQIWMSFDVWFDNITALWSDR